MKRLKIILKYKYFYFFLAILSLVFSFIYTKIYKNKSVYNLDEKKFYCVINSYKFDGDKLSLNLKCKEKLVANYYIKTLEEKTYLLENIKYGSKIYLKGNLSIPSNNTVFNAFNYKNYLKNNKIYYILNVDKIVKIKESANIFYKIKNKAYLKASKINNEYIYAFVLGNNKFIDEEILSSYRTNGISHLFALSGLHVSLFSVFILFILKKFKIKEFLSYILTFIILLFFSFICGFSVSLLRATVFFFFIGLNKAFNINLKTINIFYIVLSLFLVFNPFNIFDIGFILSFSTTYTILLCNLKGKNYFISLLYLSIISYISSLGFSIYYFHYTNILSPLLNIIFVPFVSYIIFPLSIITYIFSLFNPVLLFFINIFENISLFLNNINLIIYFPSFNLTFVYIYFLLLLCFIKLRKIIFMVCISIILVILKTYPYLNNSFRIFYLDVGQGDSIVLVSPHNKETILIDTGGKVTYREEEWKKKNNNYSISTDKIIPFLRSIGINKIDKLLISHGDADHIGEAITLLDNFKVDNVIFNCGSYNDLEKELIKALDKNNIKYYTCIKELNIDKYKLKILNTKKYNDENDNSNVIYFNYNGYKFLFMGDSGVKKEKDILDNYNLKAIDFLKVGHHGSNTSSSEYFINSIKPKYALISVGKNNRYGHPKEEVLETLKNSKIYRTDLDGSIEIRLNKSGYKISTCPP